MTAFSRRIILLLLLPAVACGRDRARSATLTRLEGEVIATGDYLDQPGQLAVAENRLVVLDRSAPRVHVFGLPGGERLASFGRNGEGPGEYRSARHVQRDAANARDVWIYDLVLRRMTRLRFGSAPVPEVREVVTLDAGGGVFLHPAWLTDTTMVVSGIHPQHPDGRLMLAGRSGRMIRMIGKAPRHPGGATIPTTVLQHAYEGPVTVRPNRSRFAIATRQADRLEVFGADGAQLAEVIGSTGFLPRFEVKERAAGVSMAIGDDLRVGYVDLASTNSRIYALFSGRLAGEAGPTAFFGREIHVFDWSGKLITKLSLDEPALTIAVDAGGTRLFAVRHEPAPSVVRYELPAAARGG